ncbi:hypothetical protein [Gloeothece verrucosa]|uniref:TubC N-terminal docking domain-containing protein n=1 Tax=Gloeothece verrucosa (strain PCC 7822) TaxID=497965 RepID=E0UL79_GLOV7|nr:hypothetical protein [Gloeothece verrucosa]ADN17709.1 conserved hypothetical protein [Gloeothece verrucosa PCC 7822]
MSIAELIKDLNHQGIKLWVDEDKLKIQSPKGALTEQIYAKLSKHKPEILTYLQQNNSPKTEVKETEGEGLSLQTLGKLIGGFCNNSSVSASYKPPIIDARAMAQQLKVTFRPLPPNYSKENILTFRSQLQEKLQEQGVNIIPWEEATRDFQYELKMPYIGWKKTIKTRVIKSEISAVIDVEKHSTVVDKVKSLIAESFYTFYSKIVLKGQKLSVSKIAQMISWAESSIQAIEDRTNTQVIVITDLDEQFTNSSLPYSEKIPIGVNSLVRTFSEILIGVSEKKLSILNMNLSDSTYPREALDHFIRQSLIPKIYVPVLPLPLSRFEIGEFDPTQSNYAVMLTQLGKEIESTGLLPAGFKLDNVIRKRSHRDIIDWIANGRTGVSYGFIAYAEPPRYVGAIEITAQEWDKLDPIKGLNFDEVRQNSQGRRYLKIQDKYHQIPDIWLVSSRSGANKTNLSLTTDIVRIGLQDRLLLQFPQNVDLSQVDIKPSYDLYVMVSIVLASALYTPKLIENGAPMVHFHGYPSIDWFAANEYCAGVYNPSVPCGTYESGVFNFLGIQEIGKSTDGNINLAALVEPDHGTNVIARDLNYLLERLKAGCSNHQIELGGKFFPSLQINQDQVKNSCVVSSSRSR